MAHGVDSADAATVAEVLVYADLRGAASHGLRRLPNYAERARAGLTAAGSAVEQVAGAGCLRRLDANHSIGPPAAVRATDLALSLAREHGAGVVAMGRATHFGPAGFYARRIAESGLVGVVLSNAPKAVAPHGAAEPFLGTNPLALGAPIGSGGVFVLDMATSSISKARVRALADAGEELEPGLALDASGEATVDPRAALEGTLLPLGGAKGSGLSFAIALLAATLADASFDDEQPAMYSEFRTPQDLGQVFVAVDPQPLVGRDRAAKRGELFLERLHALRVHPGFEAVLAAGERGDARAGERLERGIPIEPSTLDAIARLCSDAGLDELAERAGTMTRLAHGREHEDEHHRDG